LKKRIQRRTETTDTGRTSQRRGFYPECPKNRPRVFLRSAMFLCSFLV
jgi:hypothetical protein